MNIEIFELSNTWGCAWRDSEGKTHYGFSDTPIEMRAKLWLEMASGSAVSQLIEAGLGIEIATTPGAYGGTKRTIRVDVDALNETCDAYWERVNRVDETQRQSRDTCHYCGMRATAADFFGEPICSECR